jgi:hypothetical protein
MCRKGPAQRACAPCDPSEPGGDEGRPGQEHPPVPGGRTEAGARCQTVKPMAGQSQRRTGSSGNLATNNPRQSSSSPAALTAATAPAVATRAGSARRNAGSSSVPAAPSGGGSRARAPSQRGRGGGPEGSPSRAQTWRRPSSAKGDEVAAGPVDGESGQIPAPTAQGAGQHGKQHPHARRDDQRDG